MPASSEAASRSIEDEIEAIYRLYLGLAQLMHQESLGGKLLYAGTPDLTGSRLLRAANIAGAASLASSADAALLRQAMHAGAIDFMVNSLDEALRILKNEIRKKQSVAVGVSIAPESLLQEMNERGVLPDLLAPDLPASLELQSFLDRGAREASPQALPAGRNFNFVPIPPDWKQPTAAFEELLLGCLAPDDTVNRRWVRLAPRYLPTAARRLRSVACDVGSMLNLVVRIGDATPASRP